MRRSIWIAVLAAITLIPQLAAAKGMPVEDFALIDHLGVFHQLSRYSNRKAVVLFVQGNGCPVTPKSLGPRSIWARWSLRRGTGLWRA